MIAKLRTLYRDSVTGRFVSKLFAMLNPRTTTKEKR
jgi:hypothetical protein